MNHQQFIGVQVWFSVCCNNNKIKVRYKKHYLKILHYTNALVSDLKIYYISVFFVLFFTTAQVSYIMIN